MAVSKENQLELAIFSSTPSFQESLDSQRDLFQSQIGQLQNIVVTQCKLTGVNPLSQEMAAGALSINIGKRPRDLLNPKAVKYMQSVFSIKDAISKRESREISALFGVTVTQVREFFTSQRSRVRRFVRLSREKATRSNACNEKQDELQTNPTNSDPMLPINPVPLDSVGPTSVEEGPSCPPPDENLPGMDELDKHFLDNIFSLMRKEESFSGQVKLMEWILQRKNSALLMWFLTKGGVMILATWLSQAAIEEQTSVLHVILKVLCHLPLHKALPAHMSAILQSVNKLRFYRASDISNRARILLSRWSKLFARTQAMKKPSAVKSSNDAQNEMLLKQSIGEIMEAESWDSKIGINEESLVSPYESSENFRKLESQQPLKLLTASTDDSNKKLIRGVSSSQTRERRKVLLVEQPSQRTGGRSVQVAKSVPANQGRPLSADDIQKAKMRAQFMQSKYGKPGTSTNEGHQMKTEGSNKSSSSQASMWNSPPKSPVRPNIEEHKKYVTSPQDNKIRDPEEPLWKKCKRVQIRWLTPPEVRINGDWSVGNGDNSKEVEVQKNRIRREKEIIYKTVLEISSDPKEPWDREMDYDDSLTPEIPIEQLPDADANVDAVETAVSSGQSESTLDIPATTSSQNGGMSEMPEPDLELLAVLLKNPDLVFALTAGQSVGLSSEDTVKLLDMIKTNGVSAMGNNLNGGLGGKADEKKVEVSLPSPTPSSNPVTSGWRPEVAKNPFSRHMPAQEKLPLNSSVQPQISYSYSDSVVPQSVTLSMTHQTMPPFSLPQPATFLPEKPTPPVITSLPLYPTPTNIHTPTSEILTMKRFSAPSHNLPGIVMSHTPERPQPQPRPPPVPEQLLPTMHSWRARQGLSSNPHSQASQNNFNASFGGPVQPGPHWERDEYLGQPEFETWSPDRNPVRSPEYMPGRNYVEPRMNMGHNYRPDRSRPRGFSGNRDQNRFDNRRWRDRDRDRRR